MEKLNFIYMTQDEYDELIPNQFTFYKCTDTNRVFLGTKELTNDTDIEAITEELNKVEDTADSALKAAENATGVISLDATLQNAQWTNIAPYNYVLTDEQFNNNCEQAIVGLAATASETEYNAAANAHMLAYNLDGDDNTLTIIAYGMKPEIDIPVSIILFIKSN